jgi:type VI protein secretion system component VasK
MFAPFFNRCLIGFNFVCIFLLSEVPLWAQIDDKPADQPDWVLSYAIMIAFLSLTLFILLRPIKRNETAFSFDEQRANKEEEKKLRGSH